MKAVQYKYRKYECLTAQRRRGACGGHVSVSSAHRLGRRWADTLRVIFCVASATFLIASASVSAQQPVSGSISGSRPTVTASFDRDSVMIGDQFHLIVRVEKDMMQLVDFPRFTGLQADAGEGDSEVVGASDEGENGADPGVSVGENGGNGSNYNGVSGGNGGENSAENGAAQGENLEILADFPADTLSQDGRRQTIEKKYLITIWNAGDYDLGQVPVLSVGVNTVDTLFSTGPLRIAVKGFDIDPEKDKPFDIKPPVRIPLKFSEIAGWLALGIGLAALLAIAIWLLLKYRRRIPILGGEKPRTPPHVEAIRRLEALKNQKLPQNGRHKQYWSGISDILRGYLDGRFGIGAMEMTTDEILTAVAELRKQGFVDEKRYENLAEILRTADLVKFAKLLPQADETDSAWFNAYYFVEETKLAEDVVENKDKEL